MVHDFGTLKIAPFLAISIAILTGAVLNSLTHFKTALIVAQTGLGVAMLFFVFHSFNRYYSRHIFQPNDYIHEKVGSLIKQHSKPDEFVFVSTPFGIMDVPTVLFYSERNERYYAGKTTEEIKNKIKNDHIEKAFIIQENDFHEVINIERFDGKDYIKIDAK